MQVRGFVAAGAVVALVVVAFAAGTTFPSRTGVASTATVSLPGPPATTVTETSTVGPAENMSTVTEEVILQPVVLNDICIEGISTSTTTSYVHPPGQSTGNSIEAITTTTISISSRTTIYENVTVQANGQPPCTDINPYYNVTQTNGCPLCV